MPAGEPFAGPDLDPARTRSSRTDRTITTPLRSISYRILRNPSKEVRLSPHVWVAGPTQAYFLDGFRENQNARSCETAHPLKRQTPRSAPIKASLPPTVQRTRSPPGCCHKALTYAFDVVAHELTQAITQSTYRAEQHNTLRCAQRTHLRRLRHLVSNGTPQCWRAPSPLRFESHQSVLSDRQAGSGTQAPLAGPISASLRVPPERPFRPASRIGDSSTAERGVHPLIRYDMIGTALTSTASLWPVERAASIGPHRPHCPKLAGSETNHPRTMGTAQNRNGS
jgi:hypothetical protein